MKELSISIFKEWSLKKRVAKELKNKLSSSEINISENDWHAIRMPRPCGLTVHTGIGCNYACSYCYIPDMGFPFVAKPYHLNGTQLAYAISINPSVAIGSNGTFLAFGSVTEPFLKTTFNKTIDYLANVSKFLKNPVQISTKAYLTLEDAVKIRDATKGKLSILVTIITLKHYSKLEPRAPTPMKRFETLYNLKRAGFSPILFLRPIIPGVNDNEVKDIFENALSYNIKRALIGSLRVTSRIMSKLKLLDVHTLEIEKRIIRKPKNSKDQVSVNTGDIKAKIVKVAEKYDIKLYFQACQTCSEDFNIPCWMPCTIKYNCTRNVKICYDLNEVEEFLKYLGYKDFMLKDSAYVLTIYGKISRKTASFLQWVLKRKLSIKQRH